MSKIPDRLGQDRADVPVASISPRRGAGRSPRRGRLMLAALLTGLGAIAAWYVVERERPVPSSRAAMTAAPILPPVPVTVGEVERRDFPIALRGIGSVQAYNAVTVKSRVDGELQQIFFREGEDVRVGEVLAQIDPRPFEAQLQQAQAARDRDVAQLETAKLDFARSSELVGRGYTPRQTYDTQRNQPGGAARSCRASGRSVD